MGDPWRATLVAGVVVGTLAAGVGRGVGDPNPTVHVVCAAACVALEPVPASGTIDIVVLGGARPPRLDMGATALAFRACGESYCADGVVVTGPLVVHRLVITPVVGPGAVATPIAQLDRFDDAEADPFDDAVLVAGPRGDRCSGVAIDATHVLTAAHCAPATTIGVGAEAARAVRVPVARSDLHPRVDVAVLTLAAPIAVTTHARRGRADRAPPAGRLRIIGFGVRDPLRFTGFGTRRQVDVAVDGWGCPRLRAAALGCHPGLELHLRDGAGNDTCFGDSGGPVFEATDTGWRLIAITSRGAQPRKVLCGEGGIYVRVDQLAPWLEEVIAP